MNEKHGHEQGDGAWQDDPSLEEALRTAFARKPAPPGFAERVEARLKHSADAAHGSAPATRAGVMRLWRTGRAGNRAGLAIAAALLLSFVIPAGLRLHKEAEAARGEAARQQVLLALHITGSQLRSIQQRTHTININLEGDAQ